MIQFPDLSNDPDGFVKNWIWDFGDGNTSNEQHPTHSYADDGTYSVNLNVEDDDVDDDITKTVQVSNMPPSANPDGPYYAEVDESISFDGTGSTDSDGSISSYDWDFGDGNTATGSNPNHSYQNSGEYTVSLTVRDDAGDQDTETTTASINNPPIAHAGGPYECEEGESLQFDGSGSEDLDGTITEYMWDFGDGNTGTGETTTHTYSEDGEYTVTLTVTDDDSSTDTDTTMVTVSNPDIVVDAGGPYSGETGIPIQFSGSASEGTPPYMYSWEFGDGNSSTEQNPSHNYVSPGTYEVSLSVVDDAGQMGWDSTEAVIDPVSLTVELLESMTERVGTPVTFTADVSGGVPPYEYMWSFGDGNTSDEQDPTYVYSSIGEYTVSLTVRDDAGDEVVASMTVNIVDAVSDLDCTGSLSWIQVKPGETVSGSFIVSNNGDSESLLDWKIDEYPGWGSWSCTPASGTDLSAGEEIVVNVSVVVPDEKNYDFSGNLSVVNVDDDLDQECIPVSLSTPKSGIRSFWSVLVEWLHFWFPFFSFL